MLVQLLPVLFASMVLAVDGWSPLGVPHNQHQVHLRRAAALKTTSTLALSTLAVLVAQSRAATAAAAATPPGVRIGLKSDELLVDYEGDYLGLALKERVYRGSSTRVLVDGIKDDAPEAVKAKVREGFILARINGESVEGLKREDVAARMQQASRRKQIVFRDPEAIFGLLNSTTNSLSGPFTTTVLPASSASDREEQVLTVRRLERAPGGSGLRSAAVGDVLEVSYRLTRGKEVLESSSTGDGDGGAVLSAGSPASSATQFFVLGSEKVLCISLSLSSAVSVLTPLIWRYSTRPAYRFRSLRALSGPRVSLLFGGCVWASSEKSCSHPI